jgi:predicted metalloendopeptidase
MSFGGYTVEKFREIQFQFNKITSGVQKQSELWSTCTSSVFWPLKYAVSRKYVEENFTSKDKEEVRNAITLAFNLLFKSSTLGFTV